MSAIGADPKALDDADATVPGPTLIAAWETSAKLAQDEAFGLHAGERAALGAYDVLDYVTISSRTLGEALRTAARYYRIMSDQAGLSLELHGDEAHLVYDVRVPREHAGRHAWECFMAASVVRLRGALGLDWAPRSVAFIQEEPRDLSEHRRIFNCPLRFGQPVCELVMKASVLDTPLPTADAGLHQVVHRYAEELIARIPATDDLLARARTALFSLLRDGDPQLALVARRLGVSTRTLQRKLQEAGTTYQSLVDETRRQLAMHYLDDARLAIGEIAFLLGFSQPNAFHRAFRRWTGRTPAAVRQERQRAIALARG